MADNIQVTQGIGTVMATDDVSGIQYPRVKISWGLDGSAVDASATNPFPVSGPLTDTQLRASAVPISASELPLPVGAASTADIQSVRDRLPASVGAKTSASSFSVVFASDHPVIPVISNNSEVRISANFTRPADTTAYAAGDLIANSTTAGSVVPLTFANAVRTAGDCVRIERVRIEKSGTSLTNASFRLHLFEASPTPTVGDNGVFNNAGVLASNNVLNYVGAFAVTMTNSGSDGAAGFGVPATGSGVTVSPTSGTSLFGLLEVTAAYTPASGEVFYAVIEGYRT